MVFDIINRPLQNPRVLVNLRAWILIILAAPFLPYIGPGLRGFLDTPLDFAGLTYGFIPSLVALYLGINALMKRIL